MKHFGILYSIPENFVVSTGFLVLTAKNSLLSEIIYQFLASENIVKELHAKAENSVTTYPSVRPEEILNLKICLPSDVTPEMAALRQFMIVIKKKVIQNKKLEELKSLLLGKMAVEGN